MEAKTTSAESAEKKHLTVEEIEAKAAELEAVAGCKVTPVIVTAGDEQIVQYFQEPSYDTMMYAVDMYSSGTLSKASEHALRDCMIKGVIYDPRLTSNERKDARIRAAFTNAMGKLLAPYIDEYKKK